jgi:hypothetical protein
MSVVWVSNQLGIDLVAEVMARTSVVLKQFFYRPYLLRKFPESG